MPWSGLKPPVSMTTSFKKTTKKTALVSLRNFDPEDEDFDTQSTKNLMRNKKKDASIQHGHLGDINIMNNEQVDEGFEGMKYAGKNISRQELYSDNDRFEESSDESELSDSESESESENGNDTVNENENYTDNDSEIDTIKIDSTLSNRMKKLEMEDEKAFDLIYKSLPAENDKKSQHVRNQLVKFDDYVNVRFTLQPLLNSFNRLPDRKSLLKIKRRNPEIETALDEIVDELESLMSDLLDLSAAELITDEIQVSKFSNPKTETSKLQNFWDEMSRMDAAIDPFARSSLQKWHNKMTLSSDLKAKKTLKMLNQDPYEQVQIALQDEERLLARTRIYRDSFNKSVDPGIKSDNINIFDDNDFYQVLLKDWTASHGALSSATASAMSALLLSTNTFNNKKISRDNVDPRASKGRKIRYDLHAKLVNYMVPQIEKGVWADSKIDEFYASLLGQTIHN